MEKLTRRDFLGLGTKLAALLGLGPAAIPQVVEALETLAGGLAPVLWLQGLSCSGCSVSLLNAEAPGPAELLTRYISMRFHSTLSAATGQTAMDLVHRTTAEGGHILVVEGSLPSTMAKACIMGGEAVGSLVTQAARTARAVVAVGTCASFGGIPAAEANPTGALGVAAFLQAQGVAAPVVHLPGCPAHPDWIVGTLAHLLRFGLPALDDRGRPVAFYGRPVHDQCPRFADYEREHFATTFATDGCLFQLGCLGPVTHADCPVRYWNGRTNTCIQAGGPCVGCAAPEFARDKSFPFYRKTPAAS